MWSHRTDFVIVLVKNSRSNRKILQAQELLFCNLGIYTLSKKSFDELYNDRQQKAEDDHRGDGKIKPEVFLFDADIPVQATDPGELVMKKINDNTGKYDEYADHDDPFSCLTVHTVNLSGFTSQIVLNAPKK